MLTTQQNCKTVTEIIETLNKENCTIAQAQEILEFVSKTIKREATVQPMKLDFSIYEELTELY